jgi:hypothetical protein
LGGNLDDYDSLAKIIAKRSVSALSVLMPYQGQRTPEGYISGELMVSANIKGTLDAFMETISFRGLSHRLLGGVHIR